MERTLASLKVRNLKVVCKWLTLLIPQVAGWEVGKRSPLHGKAQSIITWQNLELILYKSPIFFLKCKKIKSMQTELHDRIFIKPWKLCSCRVFSSKGKCLCYNIKLKDIQNQGYIDKLNPTKNKSTARKRIEEKSCQRLSLSAGHMGDFFFLCHTFFENFPKSLLKIILFSKMGENSSTKTQ